MIFLSETCWNFCSQGISYCDVSWRKGTRLHVAVLLLLREIPGGKLGKIPPVSASQAKSRSEQWRWLGLWSLWAGDLLWLDGKQTPNSKELKHWKHLKAHVMWPFPGNWIQPHFWCVYMFFFQGKDTTSKSSIVLDVRGTSLLEQLTLGSKKHMWIIENSSSHFWMFGLTLGVSTIGDTPSYHPFK